MSEVEHTNYNIVEVARKTCNDPISEIVAAASASETIPKASEDTTEGTRSIVQRGLTDLILSKFNGVRGWVKSLKLGTNNQYIVRRKRFWRKPSFFVGILKIILIRLVYSTLDIILPAPNELRCIRCNVLTLTCLVGLIISFTCLTLDFPSRWHIGAASISTKKKTKARERWRRAFFSISFSNTMLSISKVRKKTHGYPKDTNTHDHSQVFYCKLANLVKRKDLHMLQHKFNGVKSLAAALETNLEHGIKSHDIPRRKIVFGSNNTYKKPPPKQLFYFLIKAIVENPALIMDTILIIGVRVKAWNECVRNSILACEVIVLSIPIVVSAVNEFKQKRVMNHVLKMRNDTKIEAIREGMRQKIPISEVVVGDVVILNVGDQIPADGLFIDGHSLQVDKPSMTGESDPIDVDAIRHPFLFSGSKVVNGHAQMLVTSVGMDRAWGKMMSSTASDSNDQTSSQHYYLMKFIDLILSKFNGVQGLVKSLKITLKLGTNNHDILRRKNDCKRPSFLEGTLLILHFFWSNGTILILVMYIAFAITKRGVKKLRIEGTSILLMTYLAIFVSSLAYFTLTLNIPSRWHVITTNKNSKAKERWRKAYFSIYFSNTMLSISKVQKNVCGYPISDILPASSYTAPKFIPKGFFSIDLSELNDLVGRKDLHMLQNKFNGVKSLAADLQTNLQHGIKSHDTERRKTVFGSNACNKPPPKRLFFILMEAYKDPTVVIMLLPAFLAIKGHGAKDCWHESISIFVFACVFIVSSTVNNFKQDRQMHRLSKMSNDIKIEAIREGRRLKIPISEVVVGDVVILNVGDQVPADGLFIDGHSLLVDESSMTGDIDRIKVDAIRHPFLFSGSKVVEGHAQMIVIAVGINTAWGKMMSSPTSDSNDQASLHSYLKRLTILIEFNGLIVGFILFLITFKRYLAGTTRIMIENFDHKEQFMDIIDKLKPVVRVMMTTAIDIPLVVTVTLDWCTKRMMSDHVMVRKLSGCELMGSATVICTGKTGTLTMNQMKVTKCFIGLDHIENDSSSLIELDPKVLELFHQGVGLNTTGSVSGTTPEYFGSPTEKALLSWAVMDLGMDMDKLNQDFTILNLETFNSMNKRSGVSIKKKEDATIHDHCKGAAEMVLAMCSNFHQKNGVIKSINPEERAHLGKIIEGMASKSLRCIAFAHKQKYNEDTTFKTLNEEGLTLLGIVGIKDPCRPGAKEAIDACRSAGVEIKMITGENVFTAKAIATECGILKVGQQGSTKEVIEGEDFRNYTDEERMSKIDSIRIMARASPYDKLLMVQCLKKKGHVVAVTGHDLNDALALKEADIGLSMGIHVNEVTRECSDIVILDDSITSIANTLKWGRCAFNNIQKFLQFQLTVTISALVISSVESVLDSDPPLTTVKMLWVNLIMDTLGALALATERTDIELMHKPSMGRGTPIVTHVMIRNILIQASYQIVILLTFRCRGRSFFNVSEEVNNTIIFNSFVLCHVFNLFNSRKLETKNIFEGLQKNRLFLGIIVVIVIIQVLIVQHLNSFANTEKLSRNQWGICLGVAALSWPIDWLVKFIS